MFWFTREKSLGFRRVLETGSLGFRGFGDKATGAFGVPFRLERAVELGIRRVLRVGF